MSTATHFDGSRDRGRDDGPPLRVYFPGEGDLTPDSTLGEIYDVHFRPKILVEKKRADEKTLELYDTAMGYWRRLTGDPPIGRITERVWHDDFVAQLQRATYKRGLAGSDRPLALNSQIKQQRHVWPVLSFCGPGFVGRLRRLGLLDDLPFITVPEPPEGAVPPAFTVEQCRAIYQAVDVMTAYGAGRCATRYNSRRGDGGPGADHRWRAAIAVAYWTGFRVGALHALRWPHVTKVGRRHYLDVPEGAPGLKRGEAEFRYCHPHALMLLERVRDLPPQAHVLATLAARDVPRPDELVFPWLTAHSESHILDRLEYLQVAAGIVEPLTWHAFRRCHGDQRTDLGFDAALDLGREALRHKSAQTTRKHYVEIEPKYINALKPLDPTWREPPEFGAQTVLF